MEKKIRKSSSTMYYLIKKHASLPKLKSNSIALSQKMVNLFPFSEDLGTKIDGRTKGKLNDIQINLFKFYR